MQTIKKLFRNTYQGEDIHSLAAYKEGGWDYEKEYVTNVVNNQRFGQRAAVIGNGISRKDFDLAILKNKKIQTYGCNALYRDFVPDFLVAVGKDIAKEIRIQGYAATHVVYSTPDNILNYPGTFHLIPQNPSWNAGAQLRIPVADDVMGLIFRDTESVRTRIRGGNPNWVKYP